MANPRSASVALLLVIGFFLLLSPDPQQPTAGQAIEYDRVLDRERGFLQVLNTSRAGDFAPAEGRWLNLTGLREEHGFGWGALEAARDRTREMTLGILGDGARRYVDGAAGDGGADGGDGEAWRPPLYRDVTGYARGPWVRATLGERTEGERSQVNLSAVVPEGTYAVTRYGRNVTGDQGAVRIRFLPSLDADEVNGTAQGVRAHITMRHHLPRGDEWEMTVHGVHFREFGGMLLTTTSEKFAGIFALPHFAVSPHTFATSQALLEESLQETIRRQEEDPRQAINPWSTAADGTLEPVVAAPQCEYVLYLQQHPVRSRDGADAATSPVAVDVVERELHDPTGLVLPAVPDLAFSMLAVSPDCGIVLESKGPPAYAPREGTHLRGPKAEVLAADGRRVTLGFAVVLVAQVRLMMRQMAESSTPSTRSRVSFYTVAGLSMGDGFACMIFLPLGMFVDGNVLPLLAAAFLAFLSVTFFGMRFMLDIWLVQASEERTRPRRNASTPAAHASTGAMDRRRDQPMAGPRGSTPNATEPPRDALPRPATHPARTDAAPTPMIVRADGELDSDSDDDTAAAPTATTTNPTTTNATTPNAGPPTRRELGALYLRFYLLLLVLVFTSLNATAWPLAYRSAYVNALSFLYLSFWVPQLYRNVMRNCRKALRWDFVVGQSVLRLLPLAYFYAVPDNVLLVDPDRRALCVLAGWLWVQVWALLSQELLGPRVFVRAAWVPPAYDYHPVLREDEEGATMPLGVAPAVVAPVEGAGGAGESPTSPTAGRKSGELKRDKGRRVFDCAICMQDIEVPVLPSAASGGVGADADGAAGASSGRAANLLARRAYMVTPCRHIFHSPCLEGWMRYRLQCPICREVLPPM